MESLHLQRVIGKIHDLPTLPRAVLKISELVNNPASSARDLATVITDDQVLTARLLKLVNSSFYAFPQRISTVTGAIVLLGFDAIRNLLLTTSVFDFFSNGHVKEKQMGEKLWDHSLSCAVGAKIIGVHIRYEKIEELFVAGLLHDIGKIVEMIYFPKHFAKVMEQVETARETILEAEFKIMEFDHATLGKLLAEKWNLPDKLVHVIANHHQPDKAGPNKMEAAVIHVADIMSRALLHGSGGGSSDAVASSGSLGNALFGYGSD